MHKVVLPHEGMTDEELRRRRIETAARNKFQEVWPWTPIHRAVVAGDSSYVQGWLDATFDLAVSPEHVTEWISLAHRIDTQMRQLGYPSGWSSDWRMWFKTRLETAGYFSPGKGGGLGCDRLTIDLHFCFLYLEETEDMLEALRRPDRSRDDRPVGGSGCSEPGIERTTRKLRGVDSQARRVAPTDGMED